MGRLIYSCITSLDGYIEDTAGDFTRLGPDEEVMSFVTDRERGIGTYLYGRRMYQTMSYWETEGTGPGDSAADHDFATMWRAADKVVYSASLGSLSSERTRLERTFDPERVAALKADAPSDLSVSGAGLAGSALRAGLVDDLELYLVPLVVGGGKPALPGDLNLVLELADEHRFAGGFVHLHYRVLATS